jgi:serine/threonine protein kinase
VATPRRSKAAQYSPGDTVGGYRIESEIAAGGMGRVYAATAPDGQEVALKLVKGSLADDPVFRRRFEREARSASRVSHPNVVPVLDSGVHDGVPYMVQRLVPGRSLEQEIDAEGPLPLETAVKVARQIADALEAIHAEEIVHRDLKPANVMLDEQGKVHITDFGLARHTDDSLLTMPGQSVGSMDYMAPEQIRGQEISAVTDVYAFGCLMYTCVAGKPPFADRHGVKILWAHLQDEPANPSAERDDLPEGFGEVVLSAMAKEPDERPQSASEYAREIEKAGGGG